MKICITSHGDNVDAHVDARFGRCDYFIIVDTDTMENEILSNAEVSGGAGIQAGQLMADKGVSVVLTGNVGPNAFQTLNAAQIKVMTGISGIVSEVIAKYKKGEYTDETSGPTVDSHAGMK